MRREELTKASQELMSNTQSDAMWNRVQGGELDALKLQLNPGQSRRVQGRLEPCATFTAQSSVRTQYLPPFVFIQAKYKPSALDVKPLGRLKG